MPESVKAKNDCKFCGGTGVRAVTNNWGTPTGKLMPCDHGAEREQFMAHFMPKPQKCDHDWKYEGGNPSHCKKCGMSLMAHAMMECP